ncbi:MAG TPA: ABC transporter substrate-binding protein [Trebonia sp.]|nr:ABC transporter substrate-binding protein [Trebonia sp.]
MRRPLITGATLGLAAVMAAACSSSSSSSSAPATAPSAPASGSAASSGSGSAAAGLGPQAAALQDLYNKAVAAGQTSVVIYGPAAGSDQKLYAAFQKDFPKITPSGVPVVGPPMDAKLSAEVSSGKHVGDIAYTGSTDMLIWAQKGWFTPYTPATVTDPSSLIDDAVGPNNDFYGVTTSVSGMVTNSNSNLPVPQNWSDLTSSVYKDKIAMLDPTAIGQMADILAHLSLIPADAKVESGLKANNAQVFPSSSLTGPLTAVAQGAKGVALAQGYNFYLGAKASGAPVTFTLLKADNYYTTLYQGIVKGAPHQLAAELYESWLLTPDGAAAIAGEGGYSTVKGSVAPQGLPALSSIPLQPTIPLDQIVKADNNAITSAKQYWGG